MSPVPFNWLCSEKQPPIKGNHMPQPHQVKPSLGIILSNLGRSESLPSKFGIDINRSQGDCLHVASHVAAVLRNPGEVFFCWEAWSKMKELTGRGRNGVNWQRETETRDEERALCQESTFPEIWLHSRSWFSQRETRQSGLFSSITIVLPFTGWDKSRHSIYGTWILFL